MEIKSPYSAYKTPTGSIVAEMETIQGLAETLKKLLDTPKNRTWDKDDWANMLGKNYDRNEDNQY